MNTLISSVIMSMVIILLADSIRQMVPCNTKHKHRHLYIIKSSSHKKKGNKTMQRPSNYDTVKAGGEYTPLEVGGHHLILKKVEEARSLAGRPMIIVATDTADNDKQPHYMSEEFKNDIRPEKKWPIVGRKYIVVEDEKGNCSKSFKSFITAVERSNPGFKVQWGDNFGVQFKGLRVGGVFGKAENEYNGNRSMRTELRWFCEDSRVESARVPEPKYLPDDNVTQAAPAPVPTPAPAPAQAPTVAGFVNVPDTDLEEVPF